MKKTRHTEETIIQVLNEVRAGYKVETANHRGREGWKGQGRFGFPGGWRDEKEGAEIEIGDLPVCIESSSPNLLMESVGPVNSRSPAPTTASRVSKRSGATSEILPSY